MQDGGASQVQVNPARLPTRMVTLYCHARLPFIEGDNDDKRMDYPRRRLDRRRRGSHGLCRSLRLRRRFQ